MITQILYKLIDYTDYTNNLVIKMDYVLVIAALLPKLRDKIIDSMNYLGLAEKVRSVSNSVFQDTDVYVYL